MNAPYIEAEYADGYIHSDQYYDHSPYVSFKNIFDDILHKRPEAGHGRMVRFSLVYDGNTHSIDWTDLPDNARPIRYKNMEQDYNGELAGVTRLVGIDFGYQYTDADGKNVQEIVRL